MYNSLSLIGILECVSFGFFTGLGWWLINRLMSKIFG